MNVTLPKCPECGGWQTEVEPGLWLCKNPHGDPRRDVAPGDTVSIREGRCLIVREGDTRADLIARGMKPEAVDEVLDFRAYLAAKGRGEFEHSYVAWRNRQRFSEGEGDDG